MDFHLFIKQLLIQVWKSIRLTALNSSMFIILYYEMLLNNTSQSTVSVNASNPATACGARNRTYYVSSQNETINVQLTPGIYQQLSVGRYSYMVHGCPVTINVISNGELYITSWITLNLILSPFCLYALIFMIRVSYFNYYRIKKSQSGGYNSEISDRSFYLPTKWMF